MTGNREIEGKGNKEGVEMENNITVYKFLFHLFILVLFEVVVLFRASLRWWVVRDQSRVDTQS